MPSRAVFIGYDPREMAAYAVTKETVKAHFSGPVFPIVLEECMAQQLYRRPMKHVDGQLWDVISDAPMSTEFACSRFLVPHLIELHSGRIKTKPGWGGLMSRMHGEESKRGWALFMDCDMLVRRDLDPLFEFVEQHPEKALFCVQHTHVPSNTLKMDGQMQTKYHRKNWSSVMLFNLDHPANKALTVDIVNEIPGRDLHRFFWLDDAEIGELGPEWNWLVGVSAPVENPAIVHFTNGGPWFEKYRSVPYSDEWMSALLF